MTMLTYSIGSIAVMVLEEGSVPWEGGMGVVVVSEPINAGS